MVKKYKNIIVISSFLLLGIALIVIGSCESEDSKSASYDTYVSELEAKIEKFLVEVDGIDSAQVIITIESYESTDNSSSAEAASTTLPTVRGVAVACTNGDDYTVQNKVTQIISSYLGIPSNRIKIVSLK